MEFVPAFLNKEDKQPLYYQLYAHLVREIRSGSIAAGERLPGKRTAAESLGVSVNTVDEAYQMLAAEGYVTARPRSGFVVNRLQRQLVPAPAGTPGAKGPAPPPAEGPGGSWRHSFSSGGQDLSLFPQKAWNRLLRETLAGETALFARGESFGDAVLRGAIADYLRSYRGVHCAAGQVVVGAGLEVLLGLLARLFSGRVFAMESPGYPKAAKVLQNMGLALRPLPVDPQGMPPEALEASGAGLVYITPSHQFPTGGVMPVGRRTALLDWAAAPDSGSPARYIIEDDYDSEFRFDGRPLPCLQGLDEKGHVIYAGTFSRSLAPGLRCAYLVLPPQLMPAYTAAYGGYACTVSRPEQHTLARLMAEGSFARSLNRMRAEYRRRRDTLLAALEAELPPGGWHAENTHTGLYFILRLPGQDATALAQQARAAGLALHAVDEYRPQPLLASPTADALIVGYGGLRPAEIELAAAALAQLLAK